MGKLINFFIYHCIEYFDDVSTWHAYYCVFSVVGVCARAHHVLVLQLFLASSVYVCALVAITRINCIYVCSAPPCSILSETEITIQLTS